LLRRYCDAIVRVLWPHKTGRECRAKAQNTGHDASKYEEHLGPLNIERKYRRTRIPGVIFHASPLYRGTHRFTVGPIALPWDPSLYLGTHRFTLGPIALPWDPSLYLGTHRFTVGPIALPWDPSLYRGTYHRRAHPLIEVADLVSFPRLFPILPAVIHANLHRL
jgi:hypothetical protein